MLLNDYSFPNCGDNSAVPQEGVLLGEAAGAVSAVSCQGVCNSHPKGSEEKYVYLQILTLDLSK